MKIALVGNGKMGRRIHELALLRGHEISHIFDSQTPFTSMTSKACDICIEFSHPNSAVEHIRHAATLGLPIVCGTTGWYNSLDQITEYILKHEGALFYAPNFSIGVFYFSELISQAAQMILPGGKYAFAGIELHHANKVDCPSGTAQQLAQCIEDADPEGRDYTFNSVRCGSIPGTHTVLIDGASDTIELTHRARNRDGFAQGALDAAEWLIGKKGIFTLRDLMNKSG